MKEHVLSLRGGGIGDGEGHGLEHEIPSAEVGVFPTVGHGDDIVRVEFLPENIASFPAFGRRLRHGRIAAEPAVHLVGIKFLAPEQAGNGAPHDERQFLGHSGNHGFEVGEVFFFPIGKKSVEGRIEGLFL